MGKKKSLTMWAVMVNEEMYHRSLSTTREGAESYLSDARHAAAPGARVRVVKLTIEDA